MHNRLTITILAAAATSIPASAGRIVVNNDEWTTGPVGQTNAGVTNHANFAANLGTFLAGPGGRIHIHSASPFLNTAVWIAALTNAGFQVTAGTAAFDPANVDAIFLATPSFFTLDATELAAFVNGGGGVYVAGGNNNPVGVQTNPFLNQFGLNLGTLNGFVATDPIDNPAHPLFTGVTQLYYANGNIVSLFGANPHASIIERSNTTANHALIAVYDDVQPVSNNVPEPSSYLLTGLGLAAIGCRRLIRRRGCSGRSADMHPARSRPASK